MWASASVPIFGTAGRTGQDNSHKVTGQPRTLVAGTRNNYWNFVYFVLACPKKKMFLPEPTNALFLFFFCFKSSSPTPPPANVITTVVSSKTDCLAYFYAWIDPPLFCVYLVCCATPPSTTHFSSSSSSSLFRWQGRSTRRREGNVPKGEKGE